MSEENNQVSGQAENTELPTPQFSAQATSSPSDADATVSKIQAKILEQVGATIEEMVERKFKSTTDKRFSKLEKVAGKLDLLAELEEQGVSIPKEVRSELRIRELEERLSQSSPQPAPSKVDGSIEQKQAVAEAITELNKYNLSSNDPAFLDLLRGQYPSKEAFDAKVQRYILGKVAPQQPPSPADLVQSPSAAGSTGKNVQAKIARLQALQREPTKNRAEIKQLTEELDAVNWEG